MAKKTTTRTPQFGNTRSHALNITKKKRSLNLQTVIIDGKKEVMSVREAKALKNNKAVKNNNLAETN